MKNYKDAALYIEKSVATGKASGVVHEHLGDVYVSLGEYEKAYDSFKKSLTLEKKEDKKRLLEKKIRDIPKKNK